MAAPDLAVTDLAGTFLAADLTLVGGDAPRLEPDVVVHVRGARIAGVGPAASFRDAPQRRLPGCVLTPGLVNAHQHGRGLSQLLLGLPDDRLEPWVLRRMGGPRFDVAAMVRLACAEMLRAGVTACVHANYAFGGDYEADCRAALDAYADSGLRVLFCVGAQDRGFTVYPPGDEATLTAGLSPAARALVARRRSPYAGDAAATIALMARLRAEWRGAPRLRFAYGPAGPQWVSEALLSALARDAAAQDLGLHLHLLESPAQARACRALFPGGTAAWLNACGALHDRVALAHGVHLTERDIAAVAQAGARIVHNPGSNLRLRNGAAPVAALLDAGATVALGADDTALADDADMFGEARLADGLAARPLSPAERWRMLTAAGARAAFDPGGGVIAPGARADLAAFRAPRLAAAPPETRDAAALAALRGADAVLVMVDGAALVDAEAGIGPDLAGLRANAVASLAPADAARRAAAQEAADAMARWLDGARGASA